MMSMNAGVLPSAAKAASKAFCVQNSSVLQLFPEHSSFHVMMPDVLIQSVQSGMQLTSLERLTRPCERVRRYRVSRVYII